MLVIWMVWSSHLIALLVVATSNLVALRYVISAKIGDTLRITNLCQLVILPTFKT